MCFKIPIFAPEQPTNCRTILKEELMKMKMKRWMVACAGLLAMQGPVFADKNVPVSINNLPMMARQIIKKNFSKQKIALAKAENGWLEKGFDVTFTSGDKVEFDRNGRWTEIDCKRSVVPSGLVPAAITRYVHSHYPDAKIVKIEKDKRKYEVELSNDVEITFNRKFQVTDIDI